MVRDLVDHGLHQQRRHAEQDAGDEPVEQCLVVRTRAVGEDHQRDHDADDRSHGAPQQESIGASHRRFGTRHDQERHHARDENPAPGPLDAGRMSVIGPRLERKGEQHGEDDEGLHEEDRAESECRGLQTEAAQRDRRTGPPSRGDRTVDPGGALTQHGTGGDHQRGQHREERGYPGVHDPQGNGGEPRSRSRPGSSRATSTVS